jgi:uncharacterized protein YndB with AHSA1/START domain
MSKPLIIDRTFDAPVSKVWNAISDNNHLKNWYFHIDEFKPVVGFEFHFTGGSEQRSYLHLCKVIEVIRRKNFRIAGGMKIIRGILCSHSSFFAEGDKTRLKLTHEGIETFPQGDKDFALQSFTAGWTHIIGTSLKDYLEAQS